MNASLQSQFLLDLDVTYLNFGSYGACVKPVFDNYQQWQRKLEMQPCQFLNVDSLHHLEQSRAALAAYIHCDASDVVYVTNPSYAVNIVAKGLDLQPGDEILSTDLEYGACDKTWNYYCQKHGARYVRRHIELPLTTREKVIEDFIRGINERTRLIFISHITSATALILPVEEICAIARQRGILIFIDGAHAPGHIPLNISALQPDIYTGACHKWMLAPKGCSFMYMRKALQHLFDPLIISWGYDNNTPSTSRFLDYHQGQGTRDFSAFLTIPTAIKFMKEHDWASVSVQCKKLVLDNAARFLDVLQTKSISPLTGEFIGQMLSIPIKAKDPVVFKQHLLKQYNIEIPITTQDGNTYIRYSINAFNTQDDLDKLYNALEESMSMLILPGDSNNFHAA